MRLCKWRWLKGKMNLHNGQKSFHFGLENGIYGNMINRYFLPFSEWASQPHAQPFGLNGVNIDKAGYSLR